MDIKKGVANIALAVSLTLSTAGSVGAADDEHTHLAEKARTIFAQNCVGCHKPVSIYNREVFQNVITGNKTPHYYVDDFLDLSGEQIYSAITRTTNRMPKFRESLDDDKIQWIRKWVEAGSPKWTPSQNLDSVEKSLSFTLNSLSWMPEIKLVEKVSEYEEGYYYRYFSVDGEVKFRINLEDYGWDRYDWESIFESDIVDVDEFILKSTKGYNYYRLLLGSDFPVYQLTDLYEKLGIIESDLNFIKVQNSGVSAATRDIAVLETKYGYYWESGDRKADRDSVEGGEIEGGEMIWNLPNGLQAYMITTYQDQLLYDAPIDIVRDLADKNPFEPIHVGSSCMGCHSSGMIRFDSKFDSQLTKMQEIFATALTKLGLRAGDPNPVKELHRSFDEYQYSSAAGAPMLNPHRSVMPSPSQVITTLGEIKLNSRR